MHLTHLSCNMKQDTGCNTEKDTKDMETERNKTWVLIEMQYGARYAEQYTPSY